MAWQEGAAQSFGFIIVSKTPDVCKSPAAPIPYPIVAFLSFSTFTSPDVNFQSCPVFHMASRVITCFGDEAGIGGGIVSGAFKGFCRPVVKQSSTVRCNGALVCRHLQTEWAMNCLGPEGPSNTLGTLIYRGAMGCGPVGPRGNLPSGANAVIKAKTPKELSALDKIKNSLKVDGIEDAVGLSQRAFDLSQVDWKDPSSALGALGGMAGRAGLGDLAKGLGLANRGMNLDVKDTSDLLGVLGGAASLAGGLSETAELANVGSALTFAGKVGDTDWKDPASVLATAAMMAKPSVAYFDHSPQVAAMKDGNPSSGGKSGTGNQSGSLTFEEAKAFSNLAYTGQPGDPVPAAPGQQVKYRIKEGGVFTDDSGMRAIVLEPVAPTDSRTIVAFAGTNPELSTEIEDFGSDMSNNVTQALGAVPAQYANGEQLVSELSKRYPDLVVTGHSLGAGVGTYSAGMHDLPAVGLNSAQLGGGTQANLPLGAGRKITHYNNQHDVISKLKVPLLPGSHIGKEYTVLAPREGFFKDHSVANMKPDARREVKNDVEVGS